MWGRRIIAVPFRVVVIPRVSPFLLPGLTCRGVLHKDPEFAGDLRYPRYPDIRLSVPLVQLSVKKLETLLVGMHGDAIFCVLHNLQRLPVPVGICLLAVAV